VKLIVAHAEYDRIASWLAARRSRDSMIEQVMA